jgi:small subunit ribosomal protein S7e
MQRAIAVASKIVKRSKKVLVRQSKTARGPKVSRAPTFHNIPVQNTPLEKQIAQAMYDLEANAATDFKEELKGLRFVAAREVVVDGSKKAIVMFVPLRLLRAFRRVQVRLVGELEKKFSGRHVVIIAQRRMLPPKEKRPYNQRLPRNRTLTAVHNAILSDVCFPTDITGRRTRVRVDGQRLHIVYLDTKDQQNVEPKLRSFGAVYRKLTGKLTSFEFQ